MRAVDQPLVVNHVIFVDAESADSPLEDIWLQRTGARQRGSEERQPAGMAVGAFALDPNWNEPCPAFLDQMSGRSRRPTGFQPCMGGTKRRMAGKGQLRARSENADGIVGLFMGWLDEEYGLGQIHPLGEVLHLIISQAVSVEYDSEPIAVERSGRKNINLLISKCSAHT